MFDWDNELRFYSSEYSDEKVIEVAQKAINFAYANFKKKKLYLKDLTFNMKAKLKILLWESIHICKKNQKIKNRN